MELWLAIVLIVVALLGGAAAGFFGGRAFFKKQLKDNPPISEKTIRAMFMSMGRKPSEKQVREVMRSINNQ